MKCLHPIRLGSKIVPCGKCYACLSKRRNQWAARLTEQARYSNSNHLLNLFLTLTYNEESVPTIQVADEVFKVANLQDVSAFIKRLRKSLFGSKKGTLRYFAVSEYGPKTLRPHFHLILFGVPAKKISCLRKIIERAWRDQGFVSVSLCNSNRISYCAKYCLCHFVLPDAIVEAGFKAGLRCSKGLGLCYLTSQVIDYYRRTGRFYYLTKEGYKVVLPEYWIKRIYTDIEYKKLRFDYTFGVFLRETAEWDDYLRKMAFIFEYGYFELFKDVLETSPSYIRHKERERDLHASTVKFSKLLKKYKL